MGIFLNALYCNLKVGIISSKALNPGKSKIILLKSLEDTIWISLMTDVVFLPVIKSQSVNLFNKVVFPVLLPLIKQ